MQKDSSKVDTIISRLVIRSAKLQDSGNYTCSASNAEPTSLYVHVLQGMSRLSDRQFYESLKEYLIRSQNTYD